MRDAVHIAKLRASAGRLKQWLFADALPRWTQAGIVPATGAFVEAISLADGAPSTTPHRGFVIPRQMYCMLAAGRLGWQGEVEAISSRALAWYLKHFRHDDGTFANLVSSTGDRLDAGFDLYNQAFVLFALAHAAQSLPGSRETCQNVADGLLAGIEARFSHPLGGFQESDPPSEPLRANPHMHLLEAALAWEEAGGGDHWRRLADEMVELALARLIDGQNGCLREFFNIDWSPNTGERGRQIEPGHHFEWAWLLQRWARKRGRADVGHVARRLFGIGDTYGICPSRGVAVLELNDDFSSRRPLARLWGQTEWLKAALELAQGAKGDARERYLVSARAAANAIDVFIAPAPAGLWHDKLEENGSFLDEPAPASSFYHIVCAIVELESFCAAQGA